MDNPSKRSRHNRTSKPGRKARPAPLLPIVSGEIAPPYPRQSGSLSSRTSTQTDRNRLSELIDNFTSDDGRESSVSRSVTRSTSNLVEPESPQKNENHSSLYIWQYEPPAERGKSNLRRLEERKNFTPGRKKTRHDETDGKHQRPTLGDQRHQQLTTCMESYGSYLESVQQFHTPGTNDSTSSDEQRKLYTTTLWYELKTFFRGTHSLDEAGIKSEQYSIDHERQKSLGEFYGEFMDYDFERASRHHNPTPRSSSIERRVLCENHLSYCRHVEKSIKDLFAKWDHILSLFPSHAALKAFDPRFHPETRDGQMFYEKLAVFQAWFNLNGEINRLIDVLGRIIACNSCNKWPIVPCSSTSRAPDNFSRPPTPSSSTSQEFKGIVITTPSTSDDVPSHQSLLNQQLSSQPDLSNRKHSPISSMSSIDHTLTTLQPASPLEDYYYRYIDDQLIHGRIELIASIFRSKHGSLLQRLRYIFRKEHTTMTNTSPTNAPAPFDTVFKYQYSSPLNAVPSDYLLKVGPDRLMDEFLTLNKQLQQQKNPTLMNQKKKTRQTTQPDQVNNILGRFDQNPTLTSSVFAPASAPTLVLRLLAYDRSNIKRQSYFLDYLDPTLFPHLPGSTLFPDPCTFLDNLPFNSHAHSMTDETILIGKMLSICCRLYDKDVWTDTGKFSDMFELFHLPSLYPQYVFLVQIPLDLMFAWYQYHQDRKMNQTSTTGALLLLIDECKIFIHSATLIRQYMKVMITDVLENSELLLLRGELDEFDQCIISTLNEIISYIERYMELSLRSNQFHNCITLLKDQWKSLRRYSTMMNIEETFGKKFLHMYANVIDCFRVYIEVFPAAPAPSETIKINSSKKIMQRKYQKKLTMDILREARAIYEDCALTINVYLQKPVCRRFLLILKTARFERIKFVADHPSADGNTDQEASNSSTCLLFAPAEYFESNAAKLQLARTLSSSFRIHNHGITSNDSTDESSAAQAQHSPTSSQNTTVPSGETTPPLVYVLCVPVSCDLENEWRGVTHTLPTSKTITSIHPLNANWKTTTIFLLTQQINDLGNLEKSFKERLSKTNVQQSDLYDFETKADQLLRKRSCFEGVDREMNALAHAIVTLSHSVANDVKRFEHFINEINDKNCVHMEERVFAFAMDLIREAGFYATQLEHTALQSHAEQQLAFANTWLNFVRKKRSITNASKPSASLPMWLLPGVHFLWHSCSLEFTRPISDEIFDRFYENMQYTLKYLNSSKENPNASQVRSKKTHRPAQSTSAAGAKPKRRAVRLSRIKQLESMDREIDRRRFDENLIGYIVKYDKDTAKMTTIPTKMAQDLAPLKIRNFHKMNLLSRGQYSTTYKCTVGANEVLCYKQYKIQHNDASAIVDVLDQLIPLVHIKHENLIKYRGIALEHEHILFFMEYCSHGTVAQLLLGTSPLHGDARRAPSAVVCSILDTSFVDNGIIQTTAGYAFFQEYLAQRYLKQLLSALSCLHKNEIIHRDIRNVNIFLTDASKQSIKLGDVNFVYRFKFMQKRSSLIDMEAVENIRESIVFYAPETITQNETTVKSDIWSLGCTLIHMLTGRIPWSNPSIASSAYYWKVINWVANGLQPNIPTDLSLSPQCVDFLEKCFQHDPNLRPSADELLAHPFVTENLPPPT